jgi:transposase
MEPTGHYGVNLSKWLYERNIEVVTVNPHLGKYYSKVWINRRRIQYEMPYQ